MFEIGDRVRVIRKCGSGNDCIQCPPVGKIYTITGLAGNGFNLGNDYMAINRKQLEFVGNSKPLPLPG